MADEQTIRQFGRSYKLADVDKQKFAGSKSVLLDYTKVLVPNESTMSASAVISTPAPDRVNDSMIPTGCKLDNYRKNPVIFWEHGMGGITQPIAKSEDREGNLTVDITTAAVLATSYFTDSFLEAEQIWELVLKGFIRATSIRFSPIKTSIREEDGEVFWIYEEWDLEEWSWVTIPCNPDAVRGLIAKNRLAGKPIASPILKSLQNVSPEAPVIVRGWGPGQVEIPMSVEKTNEEKPTEPTPAPKAEEKVTPPPAADPKPADKKQNAKDGSEDMELCEEPHFGKSLPIGTPYGQHFLTVAFKSLSDLVCNAEEGLKTLENAKVKEGLDEVLSTIKSSITMIEGIYAGEYAKAPELKFEPVKDDAQKNLLAFLNGSKTKRLILNGQAAKLTSLSKAKNIEEAQRKSLEVIANQLTVLVKDAETMKVAPKEEPVVPTLDPATAAKIKAAMESNNKTLEGARAVLPFEKKTG